MGSYPRRKRERAVDAVARAKRRLYRASKAVTTIASLDLRPTGHVFVTFDTVDAVQACIASASADKTYFRGAGPLQVRMPPEPEDIIWYACMHAHACVCMNPPLLRALCRCAWPPSPRTSSGRISSTRLSSGARA